MVPSPPFLCPHSTADVPVTTLAADLPSCYGGGNERRIRRERLKQPQNFGILAAIGAEALYGFSYVLTRGALDGVSPATLLALRFDLALAFFLLLVATRRIRLTPSRTLLGTAVLVALLDPVLYYIGETLGVQYTSATVSGLILSMIPVASILAAAALLGHRPSTRQLVGVGLTLAGGAATVLAGGRPEGASAMGYVMLFVAVMAFALYTVAAERATEISDADKAFIMILTGAVAFTGAAFATNSPSQMARAVQDPAVLWRVALLAIGCTVGAYLLQNIGISQIGSARYATFVGISTVVALAAGALLLGERPLPLQLVGAVAIIIGVTVANRHDGQKPA